MKYLPLLWANLRRKPLRLTLTIASTFVAFLLFGVLEAVNASLSATISIEGQDRLIVINRISIILPMPASYENRIRSIPGVKVACTQNWFGGVYQDDHNQIPTFAMEEDTFFDTYPEIKVTPEQKAAWFADQTSAVVSDDIAQRFGWKVGDVIPMRSGIFTHPDGTRIWPMKLIAIFKATGSTAGMYFHYKYFNEGLNPNMGRDSIGMVALRLTDASKATEIANKIDAMFANSSAETKTTTEQAFIADFAKQLGNIGAIINGIVTAVFFTMLLVSANTMAQSVRERTNEIAVMKTLGFSSAAVIITVVGESLLVTALGAVPGFLLAMSIASKLGDVLAQYFSQVAIPASSIVTAAILVVVLGGLSALLPSLNVWRLKITDALRHA
jgi:putative ABC transport system permease protein